MRRRLLLLALLAAGCDLSPTVDVDTPDFETRLSLRAVLGVGSPARVRVGIARDPFAAVADGARAEVPDDVTLTVWRGDDLVDTLPFAPRTCYEQRRFTCDAETGQTVVDETGPYECGRYVGTVRLDAGPVTVRAERPGLPVAQAEVVIPAAPVLSARATGLAGGRLGFGFEVDDVPGQASRFGLALLREYDRVERSVCAVGGLRDTTLAIEPRTYATSFGTDDPVLRAAAREVDDRHTLIVFDDASFADTRGAFTLNTEPDDRSGRLGTGRFAVQLAALSPVLYDYLRETTFALDTETPFDEPANLPSNVTGGYGHVGAIAVAEAPAD